MVLISIMKLTLLLPLLFAISFNSFAGTGTPLFSIQILASENPDITHLKTSIGPKEIYTEKTSSGLTRVKVGSYSSRMEAEQDLNSVKSQGFSDAFVTTYSGNKSTVSSKDHHEHTPGKKHSHSTPESPALARLTEEQKRNVVYLDGVLHLLENGTFTPLSEL